MAFHILPRTLIIIFSIDESTVLAIVQRFKTALTVHSPKEIIQCVRHHNENFEQTLSIMSSFSQQQWSFLKVHCLSETRNLSGQPGRDLASLLTSSAQRSGGPG